MYVCLNISLVNTLTCWSQKVGIVRLFNTTPVLLARKEKKVRTPTKKQLAAKARRKALKARKNIYDSEKMPLLDAIAVLRVRRFCCLKHVKDSLIKVSDRQ
jgi:hypothetical protein